MTTELWQLSATELAGRIARRETTARAATESVLARIAVANPQVNALTSVTPGKALQAADAADAKQARGDALGPLHGVPVTIKVNIDVQGEATDEGVHDFKDNIASTDSPLVQSMREAGAIIVGRNNAPAFSLRWFTDNDLHGRTLNPFDVGVTPGGSSGGAAVALALQMLPAQSRMATTTAARSAIRPGPVVWWACAPPWAGCRLTRPAPPTASSATSKCRCKGH